MKMKNILLLIGFLLVGCDFTEEDVGFSQPAYKAVRQQLITLAPTYSDMQFCLNGAAFKLSGSPEYALQYEDDFSPCIDALVAKYDSNFN